MVAARLLLCHRMLMLKMASSFLRWSIKIVNIRNLLVLVMNNLIIRRSLMTDMRDMVTQTGRFFLPLRKVVSMQLLRCQFVPVWPWFVQPWTIGLKTWVIIFSEHSPTHRRTCHAHNWAHILRNINQITPKIYHENFIKSNSSFQYIQFF